MVAGNADESWEMHATIASLADELSYAELVRQVEEQRERAENLTVALASNRRIGMAIGILMRACQMTETEAFDSLRLASQQRHQKLRDVAESVIETGELNPSRSLANGHRMRLV
jgi:AmiR/NasT family two-component response regulator